MNTVPTFDSDAEDADRVRRGIAALKEFGGDGLTREKAAQILYGWREADELDGPAVAAICSAFPPTPIPPQPGWAGNSGPGYIPRSA